MFLVTSGHCCFADMNIARYPQDDFHFYYNWKADVDQNTLPENNNKGLFMNNKILETAP